MDNQKSLSWLVSARPVLLSAFRLVVGFLYSLHGFALLFGFFGGADDHANPASPFTFIWVGGALELLGGLLIAIGLFTRVAAFFSSGTMAVAYFLIHASRGFFPIANGGELAVLYSFAFLYLSVAGGGPYGVDRFFRRGHRAADTAFENAAHAKAAAR